MFFKKRAENANTTVIPAPIALQPTTDFDGNDGSWSTFFINVGGDGQNANKGQNFRVLPSTSSAITLVPGQASWCDSDCAKGRGVEIFAARQPLGFEAQSSSSWQEEGLYNLPIPENLQLYPDVSPNGTWGTDSVGLGQAGGASLVLAEQLVVQSTSQDFYMGSFGLAALPVNFGAGDRAPFLTNFEDSNQTATISYGYAAGASYQNSSKGVVGSLVLGGYDQSRFTERNLTIPFVATGNNSLIVGIQSITYEPDQDIDTNKYSLNTTSNQFLATIDSMLPYLWLPDDICDEFAQRFQLTYDKTRNMYTVNDTAHTYNQRQNASVVFKISSGISSTGSVSITLPYAALDLQASQPIFNNATRYFPIKKSPTGIFVLGRTLLQEAYLIVDYGRSEFMIAPANFSEPMPPEHIVPILPKGYIPPSANNSGNSNTNNTGGGGGLSTGAIAGIVVGIAVVLIAALFFVILRLWKKRREQKRAAEKEAPQEIDTTAAGAEVKHRRVSELDSVAPNSPKPSVGGYYGTEGKDRIPFPPITEMESPPAELYSPPAADSTPRSDRSDYFAVTVPRRRGATRESSGNNTPGTPAIYELPGDDGEFQVNGQHFERVQSPTQSLGQNQKHNRGPSDTSLNTNIDEVIANSREPSQAPPDRRPSMHSRGPSDAPTVQSDSTAVSQPSPEELERWAEEDEEPRRPLSEDRIS